MNDCAAQWPQRRSSHKKAHKAQEKPFENFVPFCELIDVELSFEDID